MKKELSIYLDLVRFLAAVLVVIWHSNNRQIITDILPMSQYGHSAVIVFFVLSGFVIGYVADTKEKTLASFSVSRLARIYSVAPAALFITLIADQIGQGLNPSFYVGNTTHDFFAVRLLSSLAFLNEIWGVSIMAFSNVPYWSLNYEVWYYVLFGVATFVQGRWRLVLIAAIALLLGPKILLLAPVWWLGVYLYRAPVERAGERWGWILFLSSFPLIYLFHRYGIDELFTQWLKERIGAELWIQLTFSKRFLSDYILAVLIAMNFAGFRLVSHRFARPLSVVGPAIVWLAGFTFSLYLFHQPLILFFAALIDGSPADSGFYTQVMICVALSVLLLGLLTEKRKGFFRRQAARVVDWVSRARTRFYPSATMSRS